MHSSIQLFEHPIVRAHLGRGMQGFFKVGQTECGIMNGEFSRAGAVKSFVHHAPCAFPQ